MLSPVLLGSRWVLAPVVVSSTDGAAGASLTAPAGWGEQTTGADEAQATPLPSSSSPMGHGHDQSSPTSSWSSSGLPIDSTSIGPYSNATISQAAAPESFQAYQGNGTWFESRGHFGACGVAASNTDFVVALSDYLVSRFSHALPLLLLINVQDGTSVNAWVTERCAYCVGDSSLDLSKAAFAALAGPG
ncbi:hypothetical protein JCM21900_006808 [Sporobolomyces salmonicolor]